MKVWYIAPQGCCLLSNALCSTIDTLAALQMLAVWLERDASDGFLCLYPLLVIFASTFIIWPPYWSNPAAPKSLNFCTHTQSSALRYLLHFDCHFSTGRGSASQPAWRKGSCWCTLLPKRGTDSGSSATWWSAGGGVKLAMGPEGPVSANCKPNRPQSLSNPGLKGMFWKIPTCVILVKQHPQIVASWNKRWISD